LLRLTRTEVICWSSELDDLRSLFDVCLHSQDRQYGNGSIPFWRHAIKRRSLSCRFQYINQQHFPASKYGDTTVVYRTLQVGSREQGGYPDANCSSARCNCSTWARSMTPPMSLHPGKKGAVSLPCPCHVSTGRQFVICKLPPTLKIIPISRDQAYPVGFYCLKMDKEIVK
jgi:hypothetical protein